MRFWVLSDESVDFHFNDGDEKETCDLCLRENINGRCHKSRYAVRNRKNDQTFIYCHEKTTVAKQAKHVSRICTSSFDTITKACQRRSDELNEVRTIAYHNARKMNASIGQKLDKVVPDLTQSSDKVSRIAAEIKTHATVTAREILGVRKAVEQIEAEYNLVEVLDPREPFDDSELTTVRAHKLLVSSFYLYEEEFTAKRVYVDIKDTDVSLRVDYGVAKSAIAQIFSNAVKYCKKNSQVTVRVKEELDHIQLSFTMNSLKINDHDASKIVELWGRGSRAQKNTGTGIGLYAVRKYMWMHRGYIKIYNGAEPESGPGGREYAENTFILGFHKYL